MATLLEFKNYSMGFRDDNGEVYNLLDKINFTIDEGKAVGIVGESGCGKSMTSLSVMRLLPDRAVVQGGEILYNGSDIVTKPLNEIEDIRGKDISMIFQEPMTSLNPVLTVGFQLKEVLTRHFPGMSSEEMHHTVIEVLTKVGIPDPDKRLKQYPYQFSGGMRQRVMIGMAIILKPSLLIADEPTTALDVTIQAQVLDLMSHLLTDKGSMMLITHNLGVVAETCDEVIVMYAGQIAEKGTLRDIFSDARHPYTQGLLASMPTLSTPKGKLYTINGSVPTVQNFQKGCRFFNRCEVCKPECALNPPRLVQVGDKHFVSCNRL